MCVEIEEGLEVSTERIFDFPMGRKVSRKMLLEFFILTDVHHVRDVVGNGYTPEEEKKHQVARVKLRVHLQITEFFLKTVRNVEHNTAMGIRVNCC